MSNWWEVRMRADNGLVPNTSSNKQLHEPMWTIHQRVFVQFHRKCSRYLSLIRVWKLQIQDYIHLFSGPMSSSWMHNTGQIIRINNQLGWHKKRCNNKLESQIFNIMHVSPGVTCLLLYSLDVVILQTPPVAMECCLHLLTWSISLQDLP